MYGPCKACPAAVAAWSLSPAGVSSVPESGLLCLDHLKLLIRRRQESAIRAEREANRVYCGCGNELYVRFDSNGAERTTCARCACAVSGTVDMSTILEPVSIRIPSDWYTSSSCDEADCDAKMVWRYPDGTVRCAKHGAKAEPEDAHA